MPPLLANLEIIWGIVGALVLWAVLRFLRKPGRPTQIRLPTEPETQSVIPEKSPVQKLPEGVTWDELFATAERVLKTLLKELPGELKEISAIPYLLRPWPDDPDDADLMGLYVRMEQSAEGDQPGVIFLFLGPIYLFAEEEDSDFEEEVRATYLHELGHHLDLSESEVEERGL